MRVRKWMLEEGLGGGSVQGDWLIRTMAWAGKMGLLQE
jgi:hypothetical protein